MRAAKEASEVMRSRLETPVLCQGDDATSILVEQFSADPQTSLFGTLSLWQGVDVPGPSLSLVLIDQIRSPAPTIRCARHGNERSARAGVMGSWR